MVGLNGKDDDQFIKVDFDVKVEAYAGAGVDIREGVGFDGEDGAVGGFAFDLVDFALLGEGDGFVN